MSDLQSAGVLAWIQQLAAEFEQARGKRGAFLLVDAMTYWRLRRAALATFGHADVTLVYGYTVVVVPEAHELCRVVDHPEQEYLRVLSLEHLLKPTP